MLNKFISCIASFLIIATSMTALSVNCNCKKHSLLSDSSLSELTRKELKDYYEKTDKMYEDFKKSRDDVKAKLSKESQEALKKHYAKKSKDEQNETKK